MKTWNDPEALLESQRYDKPIPSRTLIRSTVEQSEHGLNYHQIVEAFALTDDDSLEALRRRLMAMLRDGQLMQIGSTYQIPNDDDEFDAVVQINQRGQGFAVIENHDDLFLPERELRLVFNGDRVRVRPINTDRRGRTQGFISEIIKHKVKELIGELCEHDGEFYIQPAQPNAHQPITLEKELVEHASLKLGDFVRIAIDDYPTRDEFATGHVVQNLGEKQDTEIIIPATILEYGLPYEFPDEVIAEAEKFKEPTAKDTKGRQDLRDLPLVTIDGEDARDFDDAVYAEKRAGGGYRVVVAIADVSHYVNIGKPLDDEAQQRGTSVYFPHFVLPMLPEALSNGLCSLNPHVDRLCMVCDLTLSRAGRVTRYEFYPAVMHSKARLTYDKVAQYLAGQTDAIVDDKAIHKSLNTLYQLYQTLLKLREQRHAMEFETVETYMTFNEVGAIEQILPRTRNDAHRLIEECMLLANVAAADFAEKNDIPILYRVHDAPEFSRIEKVRDYLKVLNLGLTLPEKPTQADYQKIIEATKDRIDATSIHAVLLRSMMQAFYTPENKGHYGLAYQAYTHFTSPIRRYPDLLLHRAIKAKLNNKPFALEGASLVAAGEHYSQTERRADEASRDVTSWLKCHYMQQHLGEEFTGVITAVTEFGMFVTLEHLYVDGMVHISQLGDDYFVFDAGLQRLTGQHRGQIFALGDKVTIQVANVNLEERKIDFALVKQNTSAGRTVREKAPSANRSSTKKATTKAPVQKANTAKQSTATTAKSTPKAKPKSTPQPQKTTEQPATQPPKTVEQIVEKVLQQPTIKTVNAENPVANKTATKPSSAKPKQGKPPVEKAVLDEKLQKAVSELQTQTEQNAEKKPKKDKKSKSVEDGKVKKAKSKDKVKDKSKDKSKTKSKEKSKKDKKKIKKSNAKKRAED